LAEERRIKQAKEGKEKKKEKRKRLDDYSTLTENKKRSL